MFFVGSGEQAIELPDWLCQAWPPIQRVIQHECNGRQAVAMNRLVEPSVLVSLLEQFSALYPGVRRPPVASQWSMNYLSVLLPATLAAVLGGGKAIAFWDEDAALLHEAGQPAALKVPDHLRALASEQRAEYWTRLVLEHLEPLMSTIASWGGLAPKVLWGNVAAVWDGAFARLNPTLSREDFTEAHRWLEQASVAGGRIRPRTLQWTVDSPAPEVVERIPLRRHCCLHYQLHTPVPGTPQVLCESCPKLHRLPQAEQASYLRSLYLDEH